MPVMKRHKTDYPGVWWIEGQSLTRAGKTERIFYVQYYKAGKRIEEKVGRQHQGMTPAKAARIRAERMEGKALTNEEKRQRQKQETWVLDSLWDDYIQDHSLKGIKTDQNRFDNYVSPILGKKELKDLAPMDVDRIRIALQKKRSLQTVKHVLALIQRLSNYAVKKRLCPGLNFKIQFPKVCNLKTEDLTSEQLQALLKAIGEDLHPLAGPMMKMALFTGMRRGELFKLQWADIDFERAFITIRNPKGGQDQKIPLNDAARGVLNDLRGGNDSPFVFPGRSGEQRVDIHKAVNAIKEKAGLPKDFRALQGLRHTYASMLASSGQVDLYTLQRLMTHKSPMMTQRYAHLRDESLRKASELAGVIVAAATAEKDERKAGSGGIK